MSDHSRDMRICWFGIYDPDYPRNYVFLDGLKEIGATVIPCRVDSKERFRYFKLIKKFLQIRAQVDVVYVAFPSQSMVILVWCLTRKDIVMDAFYSMYDTIINDRAMLSRWHPYVWAMAFVDWLSVRLATKIIVDTKEQGEYWQTWGASADKITVIPVGSSTKKYYPMATEKEADKFIVHFHGTYIPLQGVEFILEAAALLSNHLDIHFRLIGSGQTYKQIVELSEKLGLTNVTFVGRTSIADLNKYLNAADVVLGIFGDTAKARRVVPNKLFEGLAVKKPVITLDTPAIREELSGADVKLIPREAKVLAEAILFLKDNPQECARQAEQGYKTFLERFAQDKIARRLLGVL